MRDILAASLRLRGWVHDDEADPADRYWQHHEVGVRPLIVAASWEMGRDYPAGATFAYWDTYTVMVPVPPTLEALQERR
jgi:hypothetical protein